MSTWFQVAPAICVVMPGEESGRIFSAIDVAMKRMNFRADGSWLASVPDFEERYGGDYFLIGVDIIEDGKFRKRYNPRGASNYHMRMPLNDLADLSAFEMTGKFERLFIECCQDAAKRWQVMIGWRVAPDLQA